MFGIWKGNWNGSGGSQTELSDASIDAQTCCHEAKLKGELKRTERSEVRDWRMKDGQGGRETKAAVQLRNQRPGKYRN